MLDVHLSQSFEKLRGSPTLGPGKAGEAQTKCQSYFGAELHRRSFNRARFNSPKAPSDLTRWAFQATESAAFRPFLEDDLSTRAVALAAGVTPAQALAQGYLGWQRG